MESDVGGNHRGATGANLEEAALPCLFSNNCNESSHSDQAESPVQLDFQTFSTQHKKSACALAWNVQFLAEKYGIERLGFLTLTFADNVLDPRIAQRRFHSLATGVLKKRYAEYIRVWERTKSGRIHYHLLVVLGSDIRTGFDFAGVANHDYRTANPQLRAEWAFWRSTAKTYGFGRTELLPVKSTAEGIARYVGKYISKHVAQREERDKGFRLVEYSRGARSVSTRFAFNTTGSKYWRHKVALFCAFLSLRAGYCVTFGDLKDVLGPNWAYLYRKHIAALPVVVLEDDWVNQPPPSEWVPVKRIIKQ